MRPSKLLPLAVFASWVGILAPAALAQTAWRSSLYPATGYNPAAANLDTDKVIQDFSYAGYRRGEAVLPARSGPVIDVTAAPYRADSTGAADATAAIQAAIDAAEALPGGGVVFLPAGTYRLSVDVAAGRNQALLIDRSNIVLRGAGVGKTFLLNTTTTLRTTASPASKAILRVSGPWNARFIGPGSPEVALSRDLVNMTAVIPVVSTAGFAPGDTVSVRADLTDAWINERAEPRWLGFASNLGSQLAFRRTVVSVDASASTVTVDVPVRFSLKLRDNARLARLTSAPVSEVGLEDFSIGNVQHPGTVWGTDDDVIPGTPGYEVSDSQLIVYERVRDSWIRRVQTYQPAGNTTTAHLLSNGILLRDSTHVTVDSCVFQRPQYGGAGGNGYMYTTERSQECLYINSEARFSRHGFSYKGPGTSGNVMHACVDGDTGLATGAVGAAGYPTTGISSDHHMWFSLANLTDSSTADGSWFEAVYRNSGGDPIHGVTSTHSVFWNTLGTGRITSRMPATTTWVVRSDQGGHGYVIGTRGVRTAVVTTQSTSATSGQSGPVDHVEGVGQGDSLVPASLFLDQRATRLLPSVVLPGDISLPFPANTAVVTPTGFRVGASSVAASQIQIAWAAADAAVSLVPQAGGAVSVRVPGPGAWTIHCDTAYAGLSNRQSMRVVAAPSASLATFPLVAVADTYLRDGSANSTVNFGGETRIDLKRDTTVGLNRRGLLRFDTSSLAGSLPRTARLRLTSTSVLSSYAGWTVGLHAVSGAWTETGVTWNNAPVFSATPAYSYAPSATQLDVIDVTDFYLVSGGASAAQLDLGLIVSAQSTTNVLSYASRTNSTVASRPVLEIDAIPASSRFTQWIAAQAAIPSDRRAAGDDFDGDGVPNVLEMVLARDPARADATPPLRLDFAAGRVEFDLAASQPVSTRLGLEVSADLVTWSPVSIGSSQISTRAEGGARVTVPLDRAAPRQFWRLRATPDGVTNWP